MPAPKTTQTPKPQAGTQNQQQVQQEQPPVTTPPLQPVTPPVDQQIIPQQKFISQSELWNTFGMKFKTPETTNGFVNPDIRSKTITEVQSDKDKAIDYTVKQNANFNAPGMDNLNPFKTAIDKLHAQVAKGTLSLDDAKKIQRDIEISYMRQSASDMNFQLGKGDKMPAYFQKLYNLNSPIDWSKDEQEEYLEANGLKGINGTYLIQPKGDVKKMLSNIGSNISTHNKYINSDAFEKEYEKFKLEQVKLNDYYRNFVLPKEDELKQSEEVKQLTSIKGELDAYNSEDEKYQAWKATLPENLQHEGDYDLKGFWKETPDFAVTDNSQHLTDKFKLPNHPTFSTESIYYKEGMPAGEWQNETYVPINREGQEQPTEYKLPNQLEDINSRLLTQSQIVAEKIQELKTTKEYTDYLQKESVLVQKQEQLIKLSENDFTNKIINKYGDKLTPEIYEHEVIKDTNSFKYNQYQQNGILPLIPKDTKPELVEIIQSTSYLNATVDEKKIYLNDYYSDYKKEIGLSRQQFFNNYKNFIFNPIDAELSRSLAIQAKQKMKTLLPYDKRYEVTGYTYANRFSSEKVAMTGETKDGSLANLADKIVDDLVEVPIKGNEGFWRTVYKGLRDSNMEDWTPTIGGLVKAHEAKQISDVMIKAKKGLTLTSGEQYIYDVLGYMNTFRSNVSEDKWYERINKTFPNIIKFAGEMALTRGLGTTVSTGVDALAANTVIKLSQLTGVSAESLSLITTFAKPISFITGVTARTTVGAQGDIVARTIEAMTPEHYISFDKTIGADDVQDIQDIIEESRGTSFAKEYIRNYLTETGNYATAGLGKYMQKGIGLQLERLYRPLSPYVSKYANMALTMSRIPEVDDYLSKSLIYFTAKNLTKGFASGVLSPKDKLSIAADIQGLPTQNLELFLMKRWGHVMSGDKDPFYDNPFSVAKKEFYESTLDLAPMFFLGGMRSGFHSLRKGFNEAYSKQSFMPDQFDIDMINVKRASLFGISIRKNQLHNYLGITDQIKKMSSDSFMNQEQRDLLEQRITDLGNIGDKRLSDVARKMIDKREEWENSHSEHLTFSEYYDSLKTEMTQTKEFINNSLKNNFVDGSDLTKLKDSVKDETTKERIDEFEQRFNDYNGLVQDGQIESEKLSFKDYYTDINKREQKVTSEIYNYLENGGTINFNSIESQLKELKLGKDKYDELQTLKGKAWEKYQKSESVIVDGLTGVFGMKEKTIGRKLSDLDEHVNPEAWAFQTHGLEDVNGNYDLTSINNGENFAFKNTTNEVNFRNFVLSEYDNLSDNARKAIFYTLGKNVSLSDGVKHDILSQLSNNIAQKIVDRKIYDSDVATFMHLYNKVSRDLGVLERKGDDVFHVWAKMNFDYDKDDNVFHLTENEFNRARNMIFTLLNYNNAISPSKLISTFGKLRVDTMETEFDNSSNSVYVSGEIPQNIIEDAVATSIENANSQQLETTETVDKKITNKTQLGAKLKEVGYSRSETRNVTSLLSNIAKNLVSLGVYENEQSFFEKLPTIEKIDKTTDKKYAKDKNVHTERGDDKTKGIIDLLANSVTLFKQSDVPTIIKTFSHHFLSEIEKSAKGKNLKAAQLLSPFYDYIQSEDAQNFHKEKQKELYLEKDFNPDKDDRLRQEVFSEMFQKYLYEGETGIKGSFKVLLDSFKSYMKDIYNGTVKDTSLGVQISDKTRDMFERIVGNKPYGFNLKQYINELNKSEQKFNWRKDISKEHLETFIDKMKEADPFTKKESMNTFHEMFTRYKDNYLRQNFKDGSILKNSQLEQIINTPKRSNIDAYKKDIALFENIVKDSKFAGDMYRINGLKRRIASRLSSRKSENIPFWDKMRELIQINNNSITDGKAMESYMKLLNETPETMDVDTFTKNADQFILNNKSYKDLSYYLKLINSDQNNKELFDNQMKEKYGKDKSWKSKVTENDVFDFFDTIGYELKNEQESLSSIEEKNNELTDSLVNNSISQIRNYVATSANVNLDNLEQNKFFNIDTETLSSKEKSEYLGLLSQALINSDNFNFSKEMVDFTNTVDGRNINSELVKSQSLYWSDTMKRINEDWRRSSKFRDFLTNWTHNGFGVMSLYNIKDVFNMYDGMTNDYSGKIVERIFKPLDIIQEQFRSTISDVFKEVNKFKQEKTLGEFHAAGIHWLMNQLPDVKISKEDLEYYSELNPETNEVESHNLLTRLGFTPKEALSIVEGSEIKTDEFFEQGTDGVWRLKEGVDKSNIRYKLFDELRKQKMKYLADSIIASFGEVPDGYDIKNKEDVSHLQEIAQSVGDDLLSSFVNSEYKVLNKLSKASTIETAKQELLQSTGFSSVKDFVNSTLEGGTHTDTKLSDLLNYSTSLFNKLQNGEFTNGNTLKDIAENYTGERKYQHVNNYAPIIRYLTKSQQDRHDADNVSLDSPAGQTFGSDYTNIRTGLDINNDFIKTRKKYVSGIETNAYNMIVKRFDQQLFYMMNEPHRLLLEKTLNQKDGLFGDDSELMDATGRNYTKQMMSLYFRRGMTPSKVALRNSEFFNTTNKVIQDMRIAMLAPIQQSFAQATSFLLSGQHMTGDTSTIMQNIFHGLSDVWNDKTNDFLEKNAIEIYHRGISDFNLGEHTEQLTFDRMYKALLKDEWKHEKGYANEIISRLKNRKLNNSMALAPMAFFDRFAARASFMGAYRNYCGQHGIEVDFENPDAEAIEFAKTVVRKTQNTDNELYKPGVLSGISSDGKSIFGDQMANSNTPLTEVFRQGYWNFKSFSLNERNTLAQQWMRIQHADYIKDTDKQQAIGDYINSLAFSLSGKMLFNYTKALSKSVMYGLSMAIAYKTGLAPSQNKDDNDVVLGYALNDMSNIFRENITDNIQKDVSDWDKVKSGGLFTAVKSMQDYYGLNEFASASINKGFSLLVDKINEHRQETDMSEPIEKRYEDLFKYNSDLELIGFLQDIASSVSERADHYSGDNDESKVGDVLFGLQLLKSVLGWGMTDYAGIRYPDVQKIVDNAQKQDKKNKKDFPQQFGTGKKEDVVHQEELDNSSTDDNTEEIPTEDVKTE